jgi:hypothetical protein
MGDTSYRVTKGSRDITSGTGGRGANPPPKFRGVALIHSESAFLATPGEGKIGVDYRCRRISDAASGSLLF